MNGLVATAIEQRRLLKLAYAGNRIVEPHVHGLGGGVTGVFVTNEVIGAPKIARLGALAGRRGFRSASMIRRVWTISREPRAASTPAWRCWWSLMSE
jgi:hypothetical protein